MTATSTSGETDRAAAGRSAFGDVLSIDTLIDLVESKIELLNEYKLDYPQDYDDEDIIRMREEIADLEQLKSRLMARSSSTS